MSLTFMAFAKKKRTETAKYLNFLSPMGIHVNLSKITRTYQNQTRPKYYDKFVY